MNENKTPVLETKELGIDFGGLTAVNDLDLSIYDEEIVGLIGPNGAGKTTVFNLLTKVYTPTRGQIIFDGKTRRAKPSSTSTRPALPVPSRISVFSTT